MHSTSPPPAVDLNHQPPALVLSHIIALPLFAMAAFTAPTLAMAESMTASSQPQEAETVIAKAGSSMPAEIDVHRLKAMRDHGESHHLVDVREDWELKISQIEGASNIVMQDIPASLDLLPKDKPLVIMCRSGNRSSRVVAWLRQHGFDNATNLAGGIVAWAAEIDPSKETY